jgi:hypothetical protein
MAEHKKGFVLYADLIHTVSQLPDDKAGLLFKHILEYVNDNNPVSNELIVNISFEPIKQQLKRDLSKWDEIREKRSLAGKASAEKRKQNATNPTHVKSVKQTLTNPTVSVNGNVTVNVNDKVINNIYSVYPSKCPIKGNSTGKGQKDKDKIKKLLSSISEDKLIKTIEWYIADCKQSKTYIKNFSTFLNNIPEVPTQQAQNKEVGIYDLIDMYQIPKADHFGYSSERLKELIEQGKYQLK